MRIPVYTWNAVCVDSEFHKHQSRLHGFGSAVQALRVNSYPKVESREIVRGPLKRGKSTNLEILHSRFKVYMRNSHRKQSFNSTIFVYAIIIQIALSDHGVRTRNENTPHSRTYGPGTEEGSIIRVSPSMILSRRL